MEEYKYTKEHEWIQFTDESKTVAYVGITDYAQKELGEIVFIDVPTLNEELNTMSVFGSIEAVKTVADLHIPVAGKVIKVNDNLEYNPEYVNEDPFGDGWIIKVEVQNKDEFDTLMSEDEYMSYLETL